MTSLISEEISVPKRHKLLIVGLGNPGSGWEFHRHNVGFMFVEALASAWGAPFNQKKNGLLAHHETDDADVWLLKPTTWMNTSGIAVAEALGQLDLDLCEMLVIHDEMAIPFTKIKTKTGGGAAGHNGLKSIDQCVGVDYRRMRVGIGHPGERVAVIRHVLSDFSGREISVLAVMALEMVNSFSLLLQGKEGDLGRLMVKAGIEREHLIQDGSVIPPEDPAGLEWGVIEAMLFELNADDAVTEADVAQPSTSP